MINQYTTDYGSRIHHVYTNIPQYVQSAGTLGSYYSDHNINLFIFSWKLFECLLKQIHYVYRIQLLFLHSSNRSFPSCILRLCQNESKCETTRMTSDHRFIFMQQSFARRLVCARKHLTMSWLTGAFDFSLSPVKGELGYKFVDHLEGWSRPFWFYAFCFGSVFFSVLAFSQM